MHVPSMQNSSPRREACLGEGVCPRILPSASASQDQGQSCAGTPLRVVLVCPCLWKVSCFYLTIEDRLPCVPRDTKGEMSGLRCSFLCPTPRARGLLAGTPMHTPALLLDQTAPVPLSRLGPEPAWTAALWPTGQDLDSGCPGPREKARHWKEATAPYIGCRTQPSREGHPVSGCSLTACILSIGTPAPPACC